jgi:hypothetical protein
MHHRVVEELGEMYFFAHNHPGFLIPLCAHAHACVRSLPPEMPLREMYEILDGFANYQTNDSFE